MATLRTTTGDLILIDDEDLELASQYRWYSYARDVRPRRTKRNRYVSTTVKGDGNTTLYLHRLLMGAKEGEQVDHINGDVLDNRRSNLRIATRSEQGHNRGIPGHNTSGYKGVSFYKRDQRWAAYIHLPNRGPKRFLGYFDTAEEAARAYDEAAKELHGEFARPNFRS